MKKKILFISQYPLPFTNTTTDYIKHYSSKYKVKVLGYKTKDTYKSRNLEFYGYSDTLFVKNPIIRSFLNVILVPKKDIDIIFSSHHEAIAGVYNVIIAKLTKKKSIVRMAGNLFEAYKHKKTLINRIGTYILDQWIALPLLKHADIIIVMSQENKDKLIAKGYDPSKIRIIMQLMGYFDNISQSQIKSIPKSKLKLVKTKKNVFFVGNLTKGKGIDTFIKLCQDKVISKKYHFIFAGRDRDSYFPKLKQFKNITILGRVERKLIIRYLQEVDLFFFPSYFEGFPKVVTEAYSYGCPIVARELVNVDRLADAIFKTDNQAKDILLNQKFKRKKKIVWPKEFNQKLLKKQYLNLIEELRDEK